MKPRDPTLDETYTPAPGRSAPRDVRPTVLVATIAYHPDVNRVGDEAALFDLAPGRRAALARLEPCFGGNGLALGCREVSRKAVTFGWDGAALQIENGTGYPIEVDGRAIGGGVSIDAVTCQRGFSLVLGGRVVLWIHSRSLLKVPDQPDFGLVGASEALVKLRRELHKVVDLDVPVLIRGESGSGKELVARALHDHGPRRARPFVAVNLAALAVGTLASELFGHRRGAFTGADRDRPGVFEEANGGTLFLDEIGDIAVEVQLALLRVLETGQIQKVGGGGRTVDVRVVAATDADLEARSVDGSFREPLYHRLSRYVLRVPPLRERLPDVPRLFFHFLRPALAGIGESSRIEDPEVHWLPASFVSGLMARDWRGNVRALRHLAERVAIANRGEEDFVWPDEALAPRSVENVEDVVAPSSAREPSDEEISRVLEAHGWAVRPAARALGMAPNTLYERKARLAPLATALTPETIASALAREGGDEKRAAAFLKVSQRALRARLRELGR